MPASSVAPSNLSCMHIATTVALAPDHLAASGAGMSLTDTQTLRLRMLSVSINIVHLDNPTILVPPSARNAVTSLLGAKMSTI